ncbi:hypothetical protein EJ06DRAFT_262140 [Trichodelitschia bisporula]|uniref:Uncharacterized protein n=1 Tax=Trichodelitschia bisporula TaxID=703511 RepID=A0A6G1HIC4_9PEZI|nr:hypothetical protein EJ06DRAFT_262140 [Trichodelitschia bisporula]
MGSFDHHGWGRRGSIVRQYCPPQTSFPLVPGKSRRKRRQTHSSASVKRTIQSSDCMTLSSSEKKQETLLRRPSIRSSPPSPDPNRFGRRRDTLLDENIQNTGAALHASPSLRGGEFRRSNAMSDQRAVSPRWSQSTADTALAPPDPPQPCRSPTSFTVDSTIDVPPLAWRTTTLQGARKLFRGLPDMRLMRYTKKRQPSVSRCASGVSEPDPEMSSWRSDDGTDTDLYETPSISTVSEFERRPSLPRPALSEPNRPKEKSSRFLNVVRQRSLRHSDHSDGKYSSASGARTPESEAPLETPSARNGRVSFWSDTASTGPPTPVAGIHSPAAEQDTPPFVSPTDENAIRPLSPVISPAPETRRGSMTIPSAERLPPSRRASTGGERVSTSGNWRPKWKRILSGSQSSGTSVSSSHTPGTPSTPRTPLTSIGLRAGLVLSPTPGAKSACFTPAAVPETPSTSSKKGYFVPHIDDEGARNAERVTFHTPFPQPPDAKPGGLERNWSRGSSSRFSEDGDCWRIPMENVFEDVEEEEVDHFGLRDDELRSIEWDLPEHLPGSPLCPLSPKHKGGGRGICVYHGRKNA